MGRVSNKVALITGAASGLGRAAARQLFHEGAQVAIADRNFAGAEELARELGSGALALALDVTSEAQWATALDRVEQEFGRLNVLVHCAGITVIRSLEEQTLEQWRDVHAVNLDGPFLGCKLALPRMRAHAPGSIIIISSVAGMAASSMMPSYNTSKAGVGMLAKVVAVHCARSGIDIRCNAIHPGYIDTPMLEDALEKLNPDRQAARDLLSSLVPLGRIGEPDDVAHAVVYLASDESKYVTGSALVVDGGYTTV